MNPKLALVLPAALIAAQFALSCGGSASSSTALPFGTMQSDEGFKYIYSQEGSPKGDIIEDKTAAPDAGGAEDGGEADAVESDEDSSDQTSEETDADTAEEEEEEGDGEEKN
ncbi:MAG: hypothetical protein Kow0090_13020 [Myxococcota bacterium]